MSSSDPRASKLQDGPDAVPQVTQASGPERGATESVGTRHRAEDEGPPLESVPDAGGARRGPFGHAGTTASPSTARSAREGSILSHTSPSPRSPYISSSSPRSPNRASASSPQIAHDSPALDSTPARQSTLRQSSNSLRTPAQYSLQESRKSPASSRSNSLRRKPPPPLDFSPDHSPRTQTQIDRTSSPVRWTSHKPPVPETPNREEEQRDTLSNLGGFLPSTSESPVINLSIPSSNLQLALPQDPDHAAELDRDDETIGSGISYLSSSTSSSNYLDPDDQPRPYQPSTSLSSSTTGYEHGNSARPYQGVGLGLPFSVSAAANLSSLASRVPLSSSHPLPIDISSSPTTSSARDPYRSPRAHDDRTAESPVVDRGQLIGLGELATPRWTSAALERRWGAPPEQDSTDVFDRHDPMPVLRKGFNVESPTASRQTGRDPLDTTSANRPFGNSGSSSLQPVSLLPHSASASSISTQLSPVGLLNFGPESASTFGTLEFTPSSPVYSLHAESPEASPPQQSSKTAQLPRAEAPRNQDSEYPTKQPQMPTSRRKSLGAASSAPTSAGPGPAPWGSGNDVVGLGFDYYVGTGGGDETEAGSRRRISHTSVTSTAATKRTSHRNSVDGKAALKHRRQSASKSSFAHLPPSPAATTSTHSLSSSTTSLPQPPIPSVNTYQPPPAPQTSSSQSTPSTRTPEHSRVSRYSFHSHQSSPSLVAASILRHTRDLEGIDLDIEKAAAVDEGTAEALRKLDGLSSPKMARIASNSSASGPLSEPRSRKSSRGFIETPPTARKDSTEDRTRRRTRSSLAEGGEAFAFDSSNTPGASSPANLSSPAIPPLPSNQGGPPRSPLATSVSSSTTTRPVPQRVSSSSTFEVPFPQTGSPYKRGSSSSASYTFATSTSASGSHDSTSGTSFASRSATSKVRRSSGGSDISSVHSGTEGRPGVERTDSAGDGDQPGNIPPVPPLPKDWETYRPSASGVGGPPLSASTATTASSISFPSPRPEYDTRRPSYASSLENSFRSSPRMANSEDGNKDSGKVPTPTSRRKWSISSAFHKATKSPKTGGIKESSSFSDLQAPSQRDRKASSFGPRLGLGEGSQLPKRMASSTSDIASLASSRSEYSLSGTGSLGRNSVRSDKASLIARARTSSQSSSGTARTANQQNANSVATPAVVTTSPGRSRSSLINPRRTPSGIPFFSRKSSNSNEPSSGGATPSPNTEKVNGEEKNGRKSILGLNFLRSGSSKRDKDKSTLSPPATTARSTFSTSTSSSNLQSASYGTDEFGRRSDKPSDLLTRKRGKTLSSVDAKNDDVFGSKAQHSQLPPFQMPALSSTTNKRVDALSGSTASTASTSAYPKAPPSPAGSVLQTPRTRTSKLQESMRAHLPTIAGSPSTRLPTTISGLAGESRAPSQDPSPSGTPPPKSRTPTKIPRLGRIGTLTSSPKPRSSRSNSPVAATVATKTSWRRSSSFGGAGDSSNPLAASLTSSLALSAAPTSDTTSEFGSVNRDPGLQLGEKTLSTRRRLESDATVSSGIPRSKSTSSTTLASTRDPLSSSTSSARQVMTGPRAPRRPAQVEEEKRTSSASTAIPVANTPARSSQPRLSSLPASAPRATTQPPVDSSLSASTRRVFPKTAEANTIPRRISLASGETMSSSKSSRNLSTKGAIPTRVSKTAPGQSSARLSSSGTESGRSSSASQRGDVDEDEVRADEEMGAYVRRQYSKKLSAGLSEDAIRKMFEFPDPTEPLPPLEAKDALSLYSRFLSPYEKDEIRDYRKVYFVGPNSDKKPATKEQTTNNHGYDDERGDYLLVPHDHLHYRYEVINVLGKGSFGQVLQCRDHKTGDMVAIKIIRNKKRFHHQALVEIKVLENLVKWDPNEKHFVIRMVDSFTFRGHLCIVTELLSINLYELVKANSFAGFSTTLIRRFTVQILGSLSLLRHHRVVHCDLKPENILLKHPAKSAIKVIDFGSSCFEHEKVYTYIQSRFYRSPEVILGMNYHMGIDMWSLGCIIAEMFTGYPIFPGENEQEQLACIMEVMGLPDKYLVDRSSRKRLFFDSTGAPRPVVNSKGRRRRPGSKTLAQVLKTDDELFIDFIAKCLTWDPDRRLKPDPAMRHPWITQTRASIPPSIPPPRASRSSALPTSTSTRFNSISSSTNLAAASSISTPLKKLPPQPASTSTATAPVVPRTRTFSTSTIGSTTGSTRLGSKASLGLPPSSRYQVKS